METVILKDWKPGLKKISLNRLLRENAGLSLSDAKNVVDELLDGKSAIVKIPSSDVAAQFLRDATDVGAICEIIY
jgi:ribosomal protein L7/L12